MPTLPDRVQQVVRELPVPRSRAEQPEGFASDPAFRAADGRSGSFATGDVRYGAGARAASSAAGRRRCRQEWNRAVLGGPAMNYSTLLTRSVDFDDFAPIAKASYTNCDDRPMLQNLMPDAVGPRRVQRLCRAPREPPAARYPQAHSAHLRGVRRPSGGQHGHRGDGPHRRREAPRAGAHRRSLARSRAVLGIPRIRKYPYRGSALLMWDFGTPRPPTDNVPPRGDAFGDDPHDMDHGTPQALDAVTRFLAPHGSLGVICGGQPCTQKPVFDD